MERLLYTKWLRLFRGSSTASAAVRLSRHLALSLVYAYSLETINVAGRLPVNTNLSAGFSCTTGK